MISMKLRFWRYSEGADVREEGDKSFQGRNSASAGEKSPAGQVVLENNKGKKNTHGPKCLYTNAQSIGNKQDELELLIQQNKYDIIGITETWWDETHDWNVDIGGYKLFQRDRPSKKGGGGGALCQGCLYL